MKSVQWIIQAPKRAGPLIPARRHACIDRIRAELNISDRRACRALRHHRTTQRKLPVGRPDEEHLLADMIKLTRQYGRECLPIRVERKLNSGNVIDVLSALFELLVWIPQVRPPHLFHGRTTSGAKKSGVVYCARFPRACIKFKHHVFMISAQNA